MDPADNKELIKTLYDIKAIAYLGKYYAHKIRGAAELDLGRKNEEGSEVYRENAVRELTSASEYWRLYIDIAQQQYKNPLWTNRVGYVNWEQIYQWTLDDIAIARSD